MSSIIEGYNYDIFISYRQKDNKHDGWVTEFVNNLQGELESTFKEEISVYFDENPHDGLLETYDVDASLKEKLKCLIFIPVISRTYCDPKSFAWEHEFKAFVDMASKDRFGMKVTLLNGNVANRVLPVRIHDLDPQDIRECEALLCGVLRGIEFIYKEPGVNRPLNIDDDDKKNLNKTRYRNQINKVANSTNEIINGLRLDPYSGKPEQTVTNKNTHVKVFSKKIALIIVTIVAAITGLYLIIPKHSLRKVPITAQEFYERGNKMFFRYLSDRYQYHELLGTAQNLFRKAIRYDSLYAEPFVGLAYTFYISHEFQNMLDQNYLDSMLVLCNKALRINNRLSDAYSLRGLYFMSNNERNKAENELNIALKIDHHSELAHYGLGIFYLPVDHLKSLMHLQSVLSNENATMKTEIMRLVIDNYKYLGLITKARESIDDLYEINNDSILHSADLSDLMYISGNYQKSLEYYPRSLNGSLGSLWWNGFMNFFLRDYNKAISNWEKCYSAIEAIGDVTSLLYQHRIAYCYFQLNKKDKGELFLKQQFKNLEKLSLTDKNMGYENRHYYDYATAYAVKGDKIRTLQYLRKYNEQRSVPFEFINMIKNDPVFDFIRDDPGFKDLVTNMEKKFQDEQDRVSKWLKENNMY